MAEDKYSSTLLAQSSDPDEIRKGDLDLLKKINEVFSALTASIASVVKSFTDSIANLQAQITAMQITYGSNANGNWIKYPDGTIEQWGRHAVTASLGSYTINFPLSFLDNLYTITFGAENGTAPSDIYIFCYNRSASSINDYLRGAGWSIQTNFVNWHAIGKWK